MKELRNEELLYQRYPKASVSSRYPPNGWTLSLEAYKREAAKHVRCVELNNRLSGRCFRWFATIGCPDYLSIQESRITWNKITRRLRNLKLVGHWVREVSDNRIHYHLGIVSTQGEDECRSILRAAIEKLNGPSWNYSLKAVDREFGFIRYLFKAKLSASHDPFSKKIVLFRSGLGLRKHGVIGDYWVKPKRMLWQQIVEGEACIAKRMREPDIVERARQISNQLCPRESEVEIRRKLAGLSRAPEA